MVTPPGGGVGRRAATKKRRRLGAHGDGVFSWRRGDPPGRTVITPAYYAHGPYYALGPDMPWGLICRQAKASGYSRDCWGAVARRRG